jgi:hypothetical protein
MRQAPAAPSPTTEIFCHEQVYHHNKLLSSSCSSSDLLSEQALIELALQIAVSQAKASDVTKQSEDLIHQHKKKKR